MKFDPILLTKRHNNYRENSINLLPSENILSDKVKFILGSDLASRYSLFIKDDGNAYGGTRYADEIIIKGGELVSSLFGVKFAEIRPLSGHISAMIALLSITKKNDKIMAISPENGGYDGYSQDFLPDILSLQYRPIPFDVKAWNIDYQNIEKSIRDYRPDVIVLGASYFLFPYDLKFIKDLSEEYGFKIIYDSSHVMGLIAGGEFQKDIFKYAQIVYGSTHKSFFGPQGGILLTNDEEIFERIKDNVVWRTMDNYHLNRLAALVQASIEMKKYGREYASNVIRNSKRLAKNLDQKGFGIRSFRDGYTESHQILIDKKEMCKKLEKSRIIIDCVGRMGTNEITRLGFHEKDVDELSDLIMLALKKNVSRDVIELRRRFRVRYC
ncbi:MAG: DegT/DnrJ/EryC1/StrS family aminotransferase [Thermoplasmata archaeon]|jgi:glycine hydroxymethyltransferase|nr:serine hydroxymethyltransferase [Thermoplasmatales archaeon]